MQSNLKAEATFKSFRVRKKSFCKEKLSDTAQVRIQQLPVAAKGRDHKSLNRTRNESLDLNVAVSTFNSNRNTGICNRSYQEEDKTSHKTSGTPFIKIKNKPSSRKGEESTKQKTGNPAHYIST